MEKHIPVLHKISATQTPIQTTCSNLVQASTPDLRGKEKADLPTLRVSRITYRASTDPSVTLTLLTCQENSPCKKLRSQHRGALPQAALTPF